MGNFRIISSDSHLMELPDLWTSRMEPKFRDRAPRVVRMEDDGGDWWVCEDKRVMGLGIATQTGVRFDAPDQLTRTGTYDDERLRGYDPDLYIKDMDDDGVEVSVVYPSVGLLIYNLLSASDLLTGICKTYNDFAADFCQPYPKQLKPIAMINLDDVQDGVTELERCAKLGFAGAMVTAYPPVPRTYWTREYEPFWAAAQDYGMPISMHLATNRPGIDQETAGADQTPTFIANSDHWIRMSLGHMVLSGVFDRYPKLQAGAVEAELSWIPHFVDRLDYTYMQRGRRTNWPRFKEGVMPSDFVHRNLFFSFQEDALGIRLRDVIGVDNLLWGSDYPHPEATFPKSREILEDILADCTEEERAKIVADNTARVYNLD